jgi:malate dehydrogenase (oxaloacetate-decarboxylating)
MRASPSALSRHCADQGKTSGKSARDGYRRHRSLAGIAALPIARFVGKSDRAPSTAIAAARSARSRAPIIRARCCAATPPGRARVWRSRKTRGAREYTALARTVAIITNGTAVLGLGNIGALAGLPVMEGKAALFAELVGINGVPILINETQPARVVQTVLAIESSFGAIQLEDFAAPECFEIEQALRQRLAKPVMHDDQHGTAVVALAALKTAARYSGHDLAASTIGQIGLGAAGTGIARLLRAYGVKHILGTDRNPTAVARLESLGGEGTTLQGLMQRADIVIATTGVKGLIRPQWVRPGQVILALSNPDPEIEPLVRAPRGGLAADGKESTTCSPTPGCSRAHRGRRPRVLDGDARAAAAAIARRWRAGMSW